MKKLTVAATLALSLLSAQAFAANTPTDKPQAHHAGKPGHGPMFGETDTNHDGTITRAEFHAQGDKLFDKLDTNGDGKITKEEQQARHDANMAKRKERIARFDKDGDGKLNDAERSTARAAWKAKRAADQGDE